MPDYNGLSTRIYAGFPPPVVIESLKSQERSFQGDDDIRLSPHPQNVEIAYTALSLTIPERVRFHYRLQGIDKDWQDPGSRKSSVLYASACQVVSLQSDCEQ